MIWSAVLRIAAAIAGWFMGIGRALGRKEYEHESSEAHDARVAEANAARADFDELGGLHDDKYNRDNR